MKKEPTCLHLPRFSRPFPQYINLLHSPPFFHNNHINILSAFTHFEGKMSRPGDWNCRSCQHLNFQRRDSCQRCGDPRPGERGDYGSFVGRGGTSFGFTGPDVRPGDWYCAMGNCGAHNFASRSSCFKCGALKDEAASGIDNEISRGRGFGFGGGSGRSGWKSGDWICTRSGCNEHNFASRMECFRCNAPRESGSKSSF